MMYDLEIKINLKGHFCQQWPNIILKVNDIVYYQGLLIDEQTFFVKEKFTVNNHFLEIIFLDKTNLNSNSEQDQAVEIKSIKFDNISTDKMIWAGKYKPTYPEPWASEQKQKGIELKDTIDSTTYLGWNGSWKLEFTVPIYTWIHKLENLGWIYD